MFFAFWVIVLWFKSMKSFIKRVKGFHLLFVYVKMKIIKWIIRPFENKIKWCNINLKVKMETSNNLIKRQLGYMKGHEWLVMTYDTFLLPAATWGLILSLNNLKHLSTCRSFLPKSWHKLKKKSPDTNNRGIIRLLRLFSCFLFLGNCRWLILGSINNWF